MEVRVKSRTEMVVKGEKVVLYEIFRGLTNQEETLPYIPILKLRQSAWPRQSGNHMTELHLWPLFVCYRFFHDVERQLDIEDIHAMMRMVLHGKEYRLEPKLFERLDKVNEALSDVGKALCAKAKDTHCISPWITRIGIWYKQLLAKDPDVKAKAGELSGFKGRPEFDHELSRHNQVERSRADQKPTQQKMKLFHLYQHLFIHGVHHWSRDEDDEPLDGETRLNIIVNHYNLNKAALTPLDTKFLKGGSVLKAQLSESIGPRADRARGFFEPKIAEAQKRYRDHLPGPPPPKYPIPMLDPVAMATTAVEAMNLGATAGPGQDPDESDEARVQAIDADRDQWSRAPRTARGPNTDDPYNVPGPHRQPGASSTTSLYVPQVQGPPSGPQNPYRQSSQGTGPTSAMWASFMPTPQAQGPSSDPPNPYQQPPQGYGPPSSLQTPVRLPPLSQVVPPTGPAMPPPMNPPQMGPPSSFDNTVLQRQEQLQRQQRPPRQDPSRQSGDARGSDRRKKDSDKRKKDSESPPKSSEKKKRRGDRGGQK